VEPTPETDATLEELERYEQRRVLRDQLIGVAERVRALVPECVGLSVGVIELEAIELGVTFTLVASDVEWATLDAVQYMDGGPYLETARSDQDMLFAVGDATDEARWAMYARASAAAGIASSLSMPIRDGERVVGGVNLYATSPDAFDGHQTQLAEILGAWAPGAVANADLSFTTRHEAAQGLSRLEDRDSIDRAVGVIASSQGVDIDAARHRLGRAATRAGISEVQVALTILGLLDA
jgi:GAF domain-containing protein